MSRSAAKFSPSILIFDMDGVLVDVAGSYHAAIIATVHSFTGKRVKAAEIHQWKNQSGYNDDWRLTTDWIWSLGHRISYDEVKRRFLEFYWGANGRGAMRREKWIAPSSLLQRLGKRAELSIFTGRNWQELKPTLERYNARRFFRHIVTTDDVSRPKPDPEGLVRILAGRRADTALYLGDNVDDAIAARAVGVPFIGVLPRSGPARGARLARLQEEGAQMVIPSVRELPRLLA